MDLLLQYHCLLNFFIINLPVIKFGEMQYKLLLNVDIVEIMNEESVFEILTLPKKLTFDPLI
jgi:hypothetical protein